MKRSFAPRLKRAILGGLLLVAAVTSTAHAAHKHHHRCHGACASVLAPHAGGGSPTALSTRFPPAVEQWRVPIYWASRRTGVSADLIGAVMWTESNGNPWAHSITDARGLMQIEPRTGSGFHCGNLWTPGPNVNCGARILRQTIADEGGVYGGLEAYNCGELNPTGGQCQFYANTVLSNLERYS